MTEETKPTHPDPTIAAANAAYEAVRETKPSAKDALKDGSHLQGDASLVYEQCLAVAFMALQLSSVHHEFAALIAVAPDALPLEVTGPGTAATMEILVFILIGMDAVEDEDDWMAPIFAAAHSRWKSARAAPEVGRAALSAVPGWQPIETAPKDGTLILLWVVHENAAYSRKAGEDPVAKGWEGPCVGHWTDFNGGGWSWHGHMGTQTRWMPIPPFRDTSGTPAGEWGGLSSKQAWWAGYRVGKGLPPDMRRVDAVAAAPGWAVPADMRLVPDGLLDRVKAAQQRIDDNRAPRSIPADPHSDVDLVLAEVAYWLEGKWPPFWINQPVAGQAQPAPEGEDQEKSACAACGTIKESLTDRLRANLKAVVNQSLTTDPDGVQELFAAAPAVSPEQSREEVKPRKPSLYESPDLDVIWPIDPDDKLRDELVTRNGDELRAEVAAAHGTTFSPAARAADLLGVALDSKASAETRNEGGA